MTKTLSETLPKIVTKKSKRVGRGHGSGKVKTAGRGTKGQNARGTMKPGFEGGQLPITKRLPLLRGKGKNKSIKRSAYAVSINKLQVFPEKEVITLETLKKYAVIDDSVTSVKILGGGKLNRAYTVCIPCSLSARQEIEKAGGHVETAE